MKEPWRSVIAVTGLLLLACSPASAQSQSPTPGLFLAADVFGGIIVPRGSDSVEAGKWETDGWEAGATLRFVRTWLGVTTNIGRITRDEVRQSHYLFGPQVMTAYSGDMMGRLFAHALVGAVSFPHSTGSGAKTTEFILGAGGDVLGFFRLELDYVRHRIDGLPRNESRLFLGGVVPLCFLNCDRDWNRGIPIVPVR